MTPVTTPLRWMLGFSDPVQGVGWNPRASRAARWRLGRMRALLGACGAPQDEMRVVLIAGTKGKGSTAAFLAAMLHAAGVRAGLFTSPHLQTFRERIRVDGAMLTARELDAAIVRLRPIVARVRGAHPDAGEPTTFELTLALALRTFADRGCTVAVVEVGLGGRLDATNALDPAVSVLTSVSHDHTAILGRSLGTIATEKAGVFRKGRPALLAPQRPSAIRAIRRACRASGAACQVIPPLGLHADLALGGPHQRLNAALASAAARALGLGERPIARGLRTAIWPARFERIRGRPTVILDGAHNGASAEALARALSTERSGRRLVLVIGINRDKDARAVLRPLGRVASAIVVTRSTSPRASDPADVARAAARVCRAPVTIAADVLAALAVARREAGREGLVCVAGSLALAGEARTALGRAPRERWWTALAD